MLSPPVKMLLLSWRSSLATIRSGWLSRQRAEKYRLLSSKKIHAWVVSLAGSPSRGTCCTKSWIGSVVW